ncbi:MAG TPA: hypothetical protein VE991_12890 [Acidimicrobiales bacterium]|nr:hypothetical protein [Acidimicrobiales bacterium]
MALIFLVAISLVVVALATQTTNNVKNSVALKGQRSLEFGANSATEIAVQQARYEYSVPSGPNACLSGLPVNGTTFAVTCSTTYNPASASTRVVAFYTCSSGSCGPSNNLVAAQVSFNDYSAAGIDSCSVATTASCGTGMAVNSWVLSTASN